MELFMTSYEKKLKNEFNLYMKNKKLRCNKLSQWDSVRDKILMEFQNFIEKTKSSDFGNEYQADCSKEDETVQICFGYLPIAQSLQGEGKALEKGGAMVYSRTPNGEVVCFIYLCSSERIDFPKEYIFLRHYKEPNRITSKKIQKDILSLLMYQRVSSSIQYPSFWEKKRLQWKLCEGKNIAKFLNISMKSLAVLIKKII